MRDLAVSLINAFLLSLVLTLATQKFAGRIGMVDSPTERKDHEGRIPLAGSGLFVAFALAAMLLEERPPGFGGFFLSGLALLVLLGIIDDLIDVSAPIKLAMQIACVALMFLPGDILIRNLGPILPDQPAVVVEWAAPLTLIGVVGLINAINMIDGVDGLAASLTIVALLWFAAVAGMIDQRAELALALLLCCCLLGFLIFNLRHRWRSRASVFLGDAGSMMLGAILGFLAISLSQRSDGQALSPVAALWICALPLTDTASLTLRRMAAGQSPFTSDRRHLHHLMLQAGLTVNEVVATLVVISAVLGGIGVLGWYVGVPDDVLMLGLIGPVGLHIWFSLHGWKHLHWSRNAIGHAETAIGPAQASLER